MSRVVSLSLFMISWTKNEEKIDDPCLSRYIKYMVDGRLVGGRGQNVQKSDDVIYGYPLTSMAVFKSRMVS